MLTMQSMPCIWDDKPFMTSRADILGQLANWAIRQSPYLVPDALANALTEFNNAFDSNGEYFETTCKTLSLHVFTTLEKCRHIMTWNSPKTSNHTIVFCSRCDTPVPDHDFIDLHALARNIAHSITLSEKYNQAQDEYRETA